MGNSFSIGFRPMVLSIFLLFVKFGKKMVYNMSIFEKWPQQDPVNRSHPEKKFFFINPASFCYFCTRAYSLACDFFL